MDKTSLIMVSASLVFMVGGVWKAVTTPSVTTPTSHVDPMVTTPLVTPPPRPTSDAPEDRPRIARQAPVSLTASDGTGLLLTSFVARAEVREPLAFTELRLTFQNPQSRQLEGTFRVTLPEGASVSRFAMKVGGRWQEGEVVEKQAARVAYEDFLHRKQDPALLEQAAGNEFTARVFPIPPRGTKEIILSYGEEVPAKRPYTIPLRGLPQLGLVDISVTDEAASTPLQTLMRRSFAPDSDFVLERRLERSDTGLRTRNMALARVRAASDAEAPIEPLGGAVVLVDTSASRALGYAEEIDLVGEVVRRLREAGESGPLRVAAFDQVVVPVFSGKIGDFGEGELATLKKRAPLGASNLSRALSWAAGEAKKGELRRLVVVGDGVTTAGPSEGEAFDTVLGEVKSAGITRVDAIGVGGIKDTSLLRRVTSGSFPKDGMVIDGALGASAAARRLRNATLSKVAIEVPGARWFWPTRMEGVQAGDEVMVYADVPEGEAFRVKVGATPERTPEIRSGTGPLLERAWVQAKIASLVELQGRDPQPERVKEILDLSTTHRVLSPYTALLVLETEADYARFKIDRRSLRDILTMESGQLALKHRRWPFDEDPAVEAAKSEAKSSGPSQRAREEGPTGSPRGGSAPAPAAAPIAAPAEDRAANAERSAAAPAVAAQATPPMTEPVPPPAPPPPPAQREMEQSEPRPGDLRVSGGGGAVSDSLGRGGLGMLGEGAGGSGSGQGFGSGHGRLGGSHMTSPPQLRSGVVTVNGRLPTEVVQRIVRQSFGRFRLCYERALVSNPTLQGRVNIRFTIGPDGAVTGTTDGGSDLPDAAAVTCVVRSVSSLTFPAPEGGGVVTVNFPINFMPGEGPPTSNLTADNWNQNTVDPYTGRFKSVMSSIARDPARALELAVAWRGEAPGDVLALVALGEAYEASGSADEAARAYGSLIDLFASRADLRRFAGERLERIKDGLGLELASDTYEKAAMQRPDHPASHRLLAYARLKKGDLAGAFDAALNGARRKYPEGRFLGVDRILREDLGLIGAAWIKKDPSKRPQVTAQLAEVRASLETGASIRFVLNWETDANDVDFHIMDSRGGHAFYSEPHLPSGGDLYADVTTGYGPECFTIRAPKGRRAGPYKLQAHYFSRGPMGYGMGKLQVIDHDGQGGLTFEERPFVIMVDHAFVDLGVVAAK